MVTRSRFRAYAAVVVFLTIVSAAPAKYSGGTGEPNDPYQIATAADLIALGETPDDYDKHFILTADIDLDPNLPGRKIFDKAVIAPTTVEHPSPGFSAFRVTPFTGAFDGRGHQISRLTIRGEIDVGLFGQSRAEVKNVGIVNVNVTGSASTVGGLVGQNSGTVSRCYSTGSVSGNSDVGGLVGGNYGTVTDCNSTGAVTGKNIVGGLVGRNWGTLTDCRSMGAVTRAGYTTGGLVGLNGGPFAYGSVTGCYSTGPVKSSGEWVGGLVGDNWGSIAMSYSQGPVNAPNDVGGLVGRNVGSIMDSYSSGSVSGDRGVGGLVGINGGGIAIASFWDIETSGWASSDGGTGKTTAQMMDPNTFLAAGWDFVGQPDGPRDIWAEPEAGGYPILSWQLANGLGLPEFSGGTGEPIDPYRISRPEELSRIADNPRLMTCHFMLVGNLDLTGLPFYPIGSSDFPYMGVFDGNDCTVSHLTINGDGNLGLFGYLAGEAQVRNIGVVDANITGSDHVGGLVGWNHGSIMASYSTGSVNGNGLVGGLVGGNDGSLIATYSSVSVRGNWDVGGLVGWNEGSIVASYSSGSVNGGGLVGENHGSVAASFWDNQASGQTTSAGGTGKTTAEMQNMEAFLRAGWDFVGEVANGTCDYWQIAPGDYPRLQYQGGNRPSMPEGLGTADQPYLIREARDLGTVWREPLAHYRLAQAIDLSGITWSMAVIPRFGGSLDGSGYVIRNLHVQGDRYLGLFGHLDSTARVSNLGLEAVEIYGTDSIGGLVGQNKGNIVTCYSGGSVSGTDCVGGLVGQNSSGSSIATSYSTGSVSGTGSLVGGLVGANSGPITNSYSSGLVSGTEDAGGLAGENKGSIAVSYSSGSVNGTKNVGSLVGENDGPIANCYSNGSVNGTDRVGGLAGANGGPITNSYSSGLVSGTEDVGGLVGYNRGGIVAGYSSGSVNGADHVGGLVGYNRGSIAVSCSSGSVHGTGFYVGGLVGYNYLGSIVTSYSTGSVRGTRYGVGGLVGINGGSIVTSYSTGSVSGTDSVGGLVGIDGGSVDSSFWDIQSSGWTTSAGGTGKTTAEMQRAKTFLNAGWDFVGESKNGTEDIWWIEEGRDYPRLWWESDR